MSYQADAPDRIATLCEMICAAQRVVVFTGAGISTESGIPDFRGPQGVWKTRKPIEFQDFIASETVRRRYWEQRFTGRNEMASAAPNEGHRAVNTLVQAGKVTAVITQNVDGLHQASGTAAEAVIELHGNATYSHCLSCGKRYENEALQCEFLGRGTLPNCTDCDGIVKTATISFGQEMPLDPMRRAQEATLTCDLFLVLGSSLLVYPAAAFPQVAKQHGARLAIINQEATELDSLCDLVLHEQIGPTLSAAVSAGGWATE